MITVTEEARELFQSVEKPEGTVLRLDPVEQDEQGQTQIGLVAGEPQGDDEVVEHDGQDLLHIAAPVSEALDGASIDKVETEEGVGFSIPINLARWIMDPAARAAVTVAVDSPDHLARIAAVDHATGRVRVLAGTLLHQLGPLVGAHGLALANMGDIDRQSVGGALSTSTHGTGPGLTGYAGMVTGLRLATADGALHWVDAEHEPELFEAARVRLGSPGVIVEAELQCVPAFLLEAREQVEPLADVVPAFAERSRTADHLEFSWFPGTDVALTKENTRRPLGDGVDPVGTFRSTVMDGLLTNGHYGLMCRAGRGSRGSCRP